MASDSTPLPIEEPVTSGEDASETDDEDLKEYGLGCPLSYSPKEEAFGLPLFSPDGFKVGEVYTSFHGFPLGSYVGDRLGLKLGYSKKYDLHFFSSPSAQDQGSQYHLKNRALQDANTAFPRNAFFWLYLLPAFHFLSFNIAEKSPAIDSAVQLKPEQIALPVVEVKRRFANPRKPKEEPEEGKEKEELLDSFSIAKARDYIPNPQTGKYATQFHYAKDNVLGAIFEEMIYEQARHKYQNISILDKSTWKPFADLPILQYNYAPTIKHMKSHNLSKIFPKESVLALEEANKKIRLDTTEILLGKKEFTWEFHSERCQHFHELSKVRAKIITSLVATPFWRTLLKQSIEYSLSTMDIRLRKQAKRKAENLENNETAKKRILKLAAQVQPVDDFSELFEQE